MTQAEIIALFALVVSAASLLLTAKHRANDDWRREIELERRAREHAEAHMEQEIERLRHWRHHVVGEAPGLAAMMKTEQVEQRVNRLERKVFNGSAS